MPKSKEINIFSIEPKLIKVHLEGDTPLVLNKLDDIRVEEVLAHDEGRSLPKPWPPENHDEIRIVSSLHWEKAQPDPMPPEDFAKYIVSGKNRPCIPAFGFEKSFAAAVTRNKLDQYSTSFRDTVFVKNQNRLIPVEFASWYRNVTPIPLKKSGHTIAKLHTFEGWTCDLLVSILETAYSMEQVLNIINLAGFGGGIGSGRSSGYGRYHVAGVESL